MRVSGRLWTEGKVRANWGQSEGKSMKMKIYSFIYILLSPLPAPIFRTASHFAGALHTLLKMTARGYPLGTVHLAAVFCSFWRDSVASASTQSAWQAVPKNDTLKNDGTFDGTFFRCFENVYVNQQLRHSTRFLPEESKRIEFIKFKQNEL
jgi:hypothetical protein